VHRMCFFLHKLIFPVVLEIKILKKNCKKANFVIRYCGNIPEQNHLNILNISFFLNNLFNFYYCLLLLCSCIISLISTGNQGSYNYPSGGGHNANNYQFGSNSIDSSYNNVGARNTYSGIPSPTYGPAFR